MAKCSTSKLACIIVAAAFLMFITGPAPAHAMGCGRFLDKFSKCIEYARGLSREVSQVCCQGLREINNEDGMSREKRQMSCKCMIGILKMVKDLDSHYAATIPAHCNVRMPYPITTSANCARALETGGQLSRKKISEI